MIAIIFTLQNLKKVVLKYYIIVLLSGQLRRFHILLMRVDDICHILSVIRCVIVVYPLSSVVIFSIPTLNLRLQIKSISFLLVTA